MLDINVVVANNVIEQMKKKNVKQIELANAIGVTKQVMSKMLNGSRMINIAELHKISEYFGIKMDDLMYESTVSQDENVVKAFMGKVNTEAARE